MRRAVSFAMFVALLALTAGTALASQPDPLTSTWDACLGRSPKNSVADPAHQYTYSGILNDSGGSPVVGYAASMVELEILGLCPNPVVLNPDGPSDVDGQVTWGVAKLNQGGGACLGTPDAVDIRVGSQSFTTLADVRSPDVNGDGVVGLADLSAFQQSFTNQVDPHVGDMDCNGSIDLGDLGRFQNHFAS